MLNYYRDIEVLPINYQEAIADPKTIAAQVNKLLNNQLDETKMITAVDPSLQHEQS